MNESLALTFREAAFVFGDKIKDIARTFDEHPMFSMKSISGNRSMRVLGMSDLIYIQVLNEVGELLTPKGRLELHEALFNAQSKPEIHVGTFLLQLDRLQRDVEARVDALNNLKDKVEGNPEDPLIKGTSVEVYRISALFDGGASLQEIAEDYPSLNHEQIQVAHSYAKAIPKKGRPYPKISFKRSIRTLNFDMLDDVLENESAKR